MVSRTVRNMAGNMAGYMVRSGLLLLVVNAAGCSALGFDDFELYTCASDADCEPLNESDGIAADACVRWQCPGDNNTAACALRPRDDDDDGVAACMEAEIDCDDADPTVSVASADVVLRPIAELDAGDEVWVRWVATSAGLSALFPGAGGVTQVADGAGRFEANEVGPATDATLDQLPLQSGCPSAAVQRVPPPDDPVVGAMPGVTCETHEECQNGSFCDGYETCDPTSPAADAMGCRPPANPNCATTVCDEGIDACLVLGPPGACDLREVALASAGAGRLLGVAVNVSGCAAGQARVGWSAPAAPASLQDGAPGPGFVVRGDHTRAPGFFGVDAGETRCTGASRTAGALGVASPVVAALPADGARRRPQGLALWHAAPRSRAYSGATDAVGVEALGMWLEEEPAMAQPPLRWATPSDTGRPVSLSTMSRGSAPPAVAVHPDVGFVVAYAADGGGVALQVVPPLMDPPEVQTSDPFPTVLAGGDAARATPALDVSAPGVVVDGATTVERVAVAAAEGGRIGVAYVSGGQACLRTARSGALDSGSIQCVGSGVADVHIAASSDGWAMIRTEPAGVQLSLHDAGAQVLDDAAISTDANAREPVVQLVDATLRVGYLNGRQLVVGARCAAP